MRNKEPIGIELPELLDMKPKDVVELLPRMSCEELLTLRITSKSNRVCMAIQREFMRRVEPGDFVEVVDGYEKVVKVSGIFLWVEGRTQRYGASTTGFFVSREIEGDQRGYFYECKMLNVSWTATKEAVEPSKSLFMQDMWYVDVSLEGKTIGFTIGKGAWQ